MIDVRSKSISKGKKVEKKVENYTPASFPPSNIHHFSDMYWLWPLLIPHRSG